MSYFKNGTFKPELGQSGYLSLPYEKQRRILGEFELSEGLRVDGTVPSKS